MDVATLLQAIFYLIVAGIFLAIAWRVIGMVPMFAAFKEIIFMLMVLVAVVVLWNILAPLFTSIGGSSHVLGYRRHD